MVGIPPRSSALTGGSGFLHHPVFRISSFLILFFFGASFFLAIRSFLVSCNASSFFSFAFFALFW